MVRYLLSLMLLLLLSVPALGADSPRYQVLPAPGAEPAQDAQLMDQLALLHGLATMAATQRDSEMGHPAFDEALAGESMADRARLWLELVQEVLWLERPGGGLAAGMVEGESSWQPGDEPASLAHWSLAAFTYQMHHRGGRFARHELQQAINFQPLALVIMPSRQVLDRYYRDGVFTTEAGGSDWNRSSLSHGLGALQAHAYAWVRWSKPGGKADMGSIPPERLKAHLGYGRQDLVVIARALAGTLDEAWSEQHGGYDFSDGTETGLVELGALLRGHKALYELLSLFGNEADKALAVTLFDRAAQQVEALATLARPAGLPERVRFHEGQAQAASERVNLGDQWRYVMEISAGFAFSREREGTTDFLSERRPEAARALGDMVDQLLQGTLQHGFKDDQLVSVLSWSDDPDAAIEVVDATESTRTLGLLLTAAGNAYRAGEHYQRASDWEDADQDKVDRSRHLYQRFQQQTKRLEQALVTLSR